MTPATIHDVISEAIARSFDALQSVETRTPEDAGVEAADVAFEAAKRRETAPTPSRTGAPSPRGGAKRRSRARGGAVSLSSGELENTSDDANPDQGVEKGDAIPK